MFRTKISSLSIDNNQTFRQRLLLLVWVIGLCGLGLILRLLYLQVTLYERYDRLPDSNRFYTRPLPPVRGRIFDRNGQLLATHELRYSLEVVAERAGDLDAALDKIDNLIPLSDAERQLFYEQLRLKQRPFQRTVVKTNLTEKELARLAVHRYQLDGFTLESQLARLYPQSDLTSHLIGYVAKPNEKELEMLAHHQATAVRQIGKTGLEKRMEVQLRGTSGYEVVEVDVYGRILRQVSRTKPVPGKDVMVSVDIGLQRAAQKAMKDYRGTVVVLDIETSEILTLFSNPGYDPNEFSSGLSRDRYLRLTLSPDKPLFHRALSAQYPPGSVIKPVMALAGLRHQTMNWDKEIEDTGLIIFGEDERKYRDWERKGHGTVNLDIAIAQSCDIYFWQHAVELGPQRMAEALRNFGLGARVGQNLPNEATGLVPDPTWKRAVKHSLWLPGDNLNMIIGQGDILATPMQLATMTMLLARRQASTRKPFLVIAPQDLNQNLDIVPQPIAEEDWERVHRAMVTVTGYRGTAPRVGYQLPYKVAGKTGTAQVVAISQISEEEEQELPDHLRDHAIFIAYAPAAAPRIALAVVVENGGSGSKVAAPIARQVIRHYMKNSPRPSVASLPAQPSGDDR